MPLRRSAAQIAACALAAVLLASYAALPAAAAGTFGGTASTPAVVEGQPGIHYLDAMAHARDRIAFTPGGPASVPLRPRSTDRWQVDGRVPATAGIRPAALVAPGGLQREVFGFLPYWELNDPGLRLDYTLVSTIAYFQVAADQDGHLARTAADGQPDVGWAGWTSSTLTGIIDAAHAAGTRVVLTVERFAWTTSQKSTTSALLGSATARATLAGEIAAAVQHRGADGVNLDFEPIPLGQRANFVTFVQQLRAALDATQPGYQLTFDATGDMANYDVTALTAPDAADAVFVMGYDYRIASSGIAGSISPITRDGYDLQETIAGYLGATTPDKVILGLPYYGRAWSTVSTDLNARTRPQGATYGYSASAPYSVAAGLAEQNGYLYDELEQTAWTTYPWQNCDSCPTTARELYFDDARSLTAKYALVNAANLRGAGIWVLGYDGTRPELAAALRTAFADLTPPNPVPLLGSVTPATVPADGGDLAITVEGSGFAARVTSVMFNGQPIPSTVVSATQLTATVPAALIATPGMASLTVVNGPPGGGGSAPLPFEVSIALAKLSLAAGSSVTSYGATVHLVTTIASSGAGRNVTVQRMAANGTDWTDLTTLTLDGSGSAGFDYRPPVNTQFRAVYAGQPDLGATTTNPARVVVRQVAVLRPTSRGAIRVIAAGAKVAFSTTVRPLPGPSARTKVTFQFWRQVAGRWTLVAKRDVYADAAGLARWTWSFVSRGEWYVRALANPTPANANSVWSAVERYSVR